MAVSYVATGTTDTSSNVSSTPGTPAGVAVNDLLLFVYGSRGAPPQASGLTGWTSRFDVAPGGFGRRIQVFSQAYDGTIEDQTAATGATGSDAYADAIIALRGADLASPVGDSSAGNGNTGSPHILVDAGTGDLTLPNGAAVVVLGVKGNNTGTGVDALTGHGLTWTEAVDMTGATGNTIRFAVQIGVNNTGGSVTVTDKTLNVTGSPTNSDSVGLMFAILPAASGELPLQAASAVASGSMALTAPTQLPLATSAAAATGSLGLSAPTSVPLSASGAVAAGSMALTAPTSLPLAASGANAGGSLGLSAPTSVPLAASGAAAGGSLTLSTPSGGVEFTDDFNRADGDTGGDWTPDTLGAGGVKGTITGNQVSAGASSYIEEWLNLGEVGPDSEVEMDMTAVPSGSWGLVIRFDPVSLSGYRVVWDIATSQIRLYRVDSGTEVPLGAGWVATTDDPGRLRLRVDGDLLSAWIDGVLITDESDANYSVAGNAGYWAFDPSGAGRWDNFRAADLGASAPGELPLAASGAVASGSLALTAPTSIPLAASGAVAGGSLALSAPTGVPLATSAATASGSLGLRAPTGVPLAASGATAAGALALRAPALFTVETVLLGPPFVGLIEDVPALLSSAVAGGSMTLTTPAAGQVVPLAASGAVAVGSLALTAPTSLPLAASAAGAAGSLALTAPTAVPLSASAATAAAALALRAPASLILAASAIASGSLTLRAATAVVLDPAVAVAAGSMVLGSPVFLQLVAAEAVAAGSLVMQVPGVAFMPLAPASAVAAGALALQAQTLLPLAPSVAVSTGLLDLKGPAILLLSPTAAQASGLLIVRTDAALPLQPSGAVAFGTLVIMVPGGLALAPAVAVASGSLVLFVLTPIEWPGTIIAQAGALGRPVSGRSLR